MIASECCSVCDACKLHAIQRYQNKAGLFVCYDCLLDDFRKPLCGFEPAAKTA